MHLPTIDLYELGQYLRIVLWICLPLIIISLLVTTWLHYRRRMPEPGGLRLSVEGLDNAMEPERMSQLPDDLLSYRESEESEESGEIDPSDKSDQSNNDQWGKENISEWKGRDNIYQGILWMKDKYEQYRDQADQRYELLKEELNRSERRYQDLLLSMEENKSGLPPAAALAMVEAQYSQVRQQLDARQLIIDELEEQLRIERLKVEELVAKLQSNSQLLLNIYQELDKSPHTVKEGE
jgi:hypothetical protein